MANKPKGRLGGFHHAYLGVMIFIVCFILGWKVHILYGQIGCLLGILIILDDWAQHFLKVKTPLAKANDWFWEHSGVYRWLCTLADKILGKK